MNYKAIADKINKKIEKGLPLSVFEASKYFGIDEKVIQNIIVIFKNFGRQAVKSITIDDEEIDEIIRLGTRGYSVTGNSRI